MHKNILKTLTCLSLAMGLYFTSADVLFADSMIYDSEAVYENNDTDYQVYLDDWADLLSEAEEEDLLDIMKDITEYGNVAFVSIDSNPEYSTSSYANEYYQERFGHDDGTLFIIDMDMREIYICSDGQVKHTITDAYSYSITDNVYTYASEEEYYTCAEIAFQQIHTLLEGRMIAQPMKYISNALLAIVIALLVNYFLVMFLSRARKASDSQLLQGIYKKVDILNARKVFSHQTKRYSPQSSGSSGSSSGGGGRSGGGGGGGGRSGGGHSF